MAEERLPAPTNAEGVYLSKILEELRAIRELLEARKEGPAPSAKKTVTKKATGGRRNAQA